MRQSVTHVVHHHVRQSATHALQHHVVSQDAQHTHQIAIHVHQNAHRSVRLSAHLVVHNLVCGTPAGKNVFMT